jgi:predicted permease
MFNDLRYAFRMLLKSPGFTATAVLTLALGIGANTAIFSLLDAVMFKMLPVKNPEQLVQLVRPFAKGGINTSFSYPDFERFRDQNRVCSGMLAFFRLSRSNVYVNGQAELATSEVVSGSYFSILGVSAALGRTFTPEDDLAPGKHPVAVISHGYWQRRFAGNDSVLGKIIVVNGASFVIIGVTPAKFSGVSLEEPPDIYLPVMMQAQVMPGEPLFQKPHSQWLQIIGRLKPGIPRRQAQASLTVLLRQLIAESATSVPPEEHETVKRWISEQRLELKPVGRGTDSSLRRKFSTALQILMTVVCLVLLIACANVANLLLARSRARGREMAVRLAIGATRLRLIRQLLAESLLLATIGSLLGLLFALWGTDLLLTMVAKGPTPVRIDLSLDFRLLGFTAAVSLLTVVLFGLAPALRASRVDLVPALKENAAGFVGGGSRLMLGKVLVVSQVALSLSLLIGAGLFIHSLQNLRRFDAGFRRENILLFSLDPGLVGYKDGQLTNLYKQLLERLSALPGARSVSLSSVTPMDNTQWISEVSVQGYAPTSNEGMLIERNAVGPKYFETMGTPILLGREFGPGDDGNAPKVAIINQTMARTYFADDNPIGKRIGLYGQGWENNQTEIVGVVKDSRYDNLRRTPRPLVYTPFLQRDSNLEGMTFMVRTVTNPVSLMDRVRREVQALDKNVPLFNVKTLTAQVETSLIQERLIATLSGFFGLLALLLACVGLYGIMSYAVIQRTNEIGIRMALGAQHRDVLWLVLRETLLLVSVGMAIGFPIAFAATHLISSQLFGLTPMDPLAISASTLLLAAVAALAGYLPARRATKVDPMVALRYE